MEDLEYCEVCCDWFPVDDTGDVQCECPDDPYAENPRRSLDFND